jgi:hypothetical protein
MRKEIFILAIALILIIPMISSINLEVEKKSIEEVMIQDLNHPATIKLEITNNGMSEQLTFFNLLGFTMEPAKSFQLKSKETKNIDLKIYPREGFSYRGYYTLEYGIRGSDSEHYYEEITFKIINFEDVFDISVSELDPESSKISVRITNKENVMFDNLEAEFLSAFFNLEEEFSLKPYESKQFQVSLEKEQYNELLAGFYTLTANIKSQNKSITIESPIKFIEKDIVTSEENKFGVIINTDIITKQNKGNTVIETTTTAKKNIISRLFTTLSPEPDSVLRKGSAVYYTWVTELNPGETKVIEIKTNWTFPFIIVILIIVIVLLTKRINQTDLLLRKRITFVKATGGEFALKVTITATARKYIENITITDRLPLMAKLHERFGGIPPTNINEKAKKLEWNLQRLEEGEMRSMSYIIYSKIGVLGRFALPSTRAVFESNGKFKESESNKTYFVAEQRGKKDEYED